MMKDSGMKKHWRVLLAAAVLIVLAVVPVAPGVNAQEPSGTQFQITIDSNAHLTYGLYYPVTYMFQIPSGSSGLTAQYRFNVGDAWTGLEEQTSSDFFNGINAARFDYANDTAYLSVAFSADSDDIFLRVLDGQSEVLMDYLGIPLYYDNRPAAVTVTLDDWSQYNDYYFSIAVGMLTAAHVYHTVGILTLDGGAPPDWSQIQAAVSAGYTEPGAHTRTHPCSDSEYQQNGYAWEIAGSRDDILTNLTLAHPYVPAFFEPCGFTSLDVRQAVVAAGYLADRGYPLPPVENTFAPWAGDGAYERVTYTYDTWAWPEGGGSQALLDEANSSFDSVYAAGGIYHLMNHPWRGHWSAGSYLSQHIDYINDRTDVWYAGFGHLYLYHYVQERGQVTVSATGGTAVQLSGFTASNGIVRWETAIEIDTVGFNLWRATNASGPYTQVNESLIPSASPGSVTGGVYEFDDSAKCGVVACYYILEEIESGGTSSKYGPIENEVAPTDIVLKSASVSKNSGVIALVLAVAVVSVLICRANVGWFSTRVRNTVIERRKW